MIKLRSKGSWKKTEKFLKKTMGADYMSVLNKYGEKGASALASATPKDSGLTSGSWGYTIERTDDGFSVVWTNSNVANGYFNVAVMLQYGHGTRNGGWVEGVDYINPALKPIFDELADQAWKEVRGL